MSNEIVIAGDWHKATIWGVATIRRAAEKGIDTIYHLGDFGFYGGGREWRMNELGEACKHYGVKIWVTPGNHENWDDLYDLFDIFPDEPAPIEPSEHVFMLPPGFRWTRNDVSFVSLGGAPSIDKNFCVPGIDWWAKETITLGEAMRTIEAGPADIMLTHDAPDYGPGKVHDIIYTDAEAKAKYWGVEVLKYCGEGRRVLNGVYEAVQPKALFHGHMHVWDHYTNPDTGQHIVALPQEGKKQNGVIIDLDKAKTGVIQPRPLGAYIH